MVDTYLLCGLPQYFLYAGRDEHEPARYGLPYYSSMCRPPPRPTICPDQNPPSKRSCVLPQPCSDQDPPSERGFAWYCLSILVNALVLLCSAVLHVVFCSFLFWPSTVVLIINSSFHTSRFPSIEAFICSVYFRNLLPLFDLFTTAVQHVFYLPATHEQTQ